MLKALLITALVSQVSAFAADAKDQKSLFAKTQPHLAKFHAEVMAESRLPRKEDVKSLLSLLEANRPAVQRYGALTEGRALKAEKVEEKTAL